MSRDAVVMAHTAIGRKQSRLAPGTTFVRDERAVEADREVFAKVATIRKLSLAPIPTVVISARSESSNQESQEALVTTHSTPKSRKSILQTPPARAQVSGLLRRPSTAASAHSRVHQALRHSESEFVFSSKESTIEGFLYSSRFEHLHNDNSSNMNSPLARRDRPSSSSTLDPRIRQKLAKVGKSVRAAASIASSRAPGANNVAEADSAASDAQDGLTAIDPVTGKPLSRHHLDHAEEERAFLQRKRRCAKTFEEMIYARLAEVRDAATLNQSMASLLGHGIIPSVLELSAITDAAAQAHCCRALYYLSQVPSARKQMVAHGVVCVIKGLSRIAASRPRQDLAATLCHLAEESGLVEVLLFEGIDQSLARISAAPSAETKRICALTVFNISADALTIHHYGDAFTQLLVASTRTSSHAAASSLIKAVYNASLAPAYHAALLSETIPRFLLQQLPHVVPSVQIIALRALVALCANRVNRAQILTHDICKLLESMLASTTADIVETTLMILLLLSIDDGSRIKLCNWVPASAIVQNARRHVASTSVGTAESCSLVSDSEGEHTNDRLVYLQSCILRNLCDSVLTHHELVEDDAVQVLFAMSRLANSSIKTNAICALSCILASSTDEAASYMLDLTAELLALTRCDSLKTVAFAVGALYNIACSDDCLPLLAASPQLLERMLELATSSDRLPQHERVTELVAAILYRLAGIDAYQATMLQRGVFAVLVRVIHDVSSARVYAMHALYVLAQDSGGEHFPHGSDDITQLAKALSGEFDVDKHGGGIDSTTPAALAAVYTHSRSTTATTAAATTILSCAVTLLAYVARQTANQIPLLRSGVVFRFLHRVQRLETDPTILINCAYVYFCLTATHVGCEQLVREQGIEDIVSLSRTTKLSTVQNEAVKELCMLAFCRLSAFVGLEVRLIEHGAIDAVMILALVATDSARIKALCIKTLANCLVAKNCVRPLIDHGVIWALASLCHVDSVETQYACAVSLCNLSATSNMLSRFLDAGAPRALIHLLQQRDSATVLVTIKAIANLVASEKICSVLIHEDLERHLSAHFADPTSSPELRQLAAMVLLRVSSANNAVISPERLTHGVFVWMEQIIDMHDAALVRNCMLTVHDLTSSTTLDVAALDVEHIFRIVEQVLQRHAQHDDVVTLSLTIVYNLSCQRAVLSRLIVPSIMHFMRQRVPCGDASSCGTKALVRIDSSNCNSNSSSSIRKLQSIAATSVRDMDASPASSIAADVKLCCLVLHNLSCHVAASLDTATDAATDDVLALLVRLDAVAILRDIYFQRDDLQVECAIATSNIVVGKVNSTRVLESGAATVLLHYITSTLLFDAQHYALVSAALRKLANAPGNQQQLLDAGIASAAVHMLALPELGDAATLNVLTTLALLSKCDRHLMRLLDDGVLPSIVRLAEATPTTTATSIRSDILSLCFEILSNVCTTNFEVHVQQNPEINVISTLSKLSEHRHVHGTSRSATLFTSQRQQNLSSVVARASSSSSIRPSVSPTKAASSGSYLDRGDDHVLGVPQLLTCLLKSPSSASSLKKNLELTATYTVPACKFVPETHAVVPQDPPLLECDEIPLTETSQSIPSDVKQRIRDLAPLTKEALVRNESADEVDASFASSSRHVVVVSPSDNSITPSTGIDSSSGHLDTSVPPHLPPKAIRTHNAKHNVATSAVAGSKTLQRGGLASRNLSRSSASKNRTSTS